MGRKKLDRKLIAFSLRLTEREHADLMQAADICGMTPTALLRRAVMLHVRHVREHEAEIRQLFGTVIRAHDRERE